MDLKSYFLVVGVMTYQSSEIEISNIHYTTSCPLNKESFISSSKEFGLCAERFKTYHCVLSTTEEYFEGCFQPMVFGKNKCPRLRWIIDKEFGLSYVHCSTHLNMSCPDSQYLSTSLYKYTGCFPYELSTSADLRNSTSTNEILNQCKKDASKKNHSMTAFLAAGTPLVFCVSVMITICCTRRIIRMIEFEESDQDSKLRPLAVPV